VIAVLGIGGVGGMIAVRTGAVCLASERVAAAIREHGLSLEQAGVVTTVRPRLLERLDVPVRLLVVAVKSSQLQDAVGRIDASALRGTAVLPLLNGLEHVDRLRELLPGAAVVAGSIGRYEGASLRPGHVVQQSDGALVRVASDTISGDELERAVAGLRVPGLSVELGVSEAEVLWEKAARLAVLAAATTAARAPLGELRRDARTARTLRAAIAEACAIAAAEGVSLDPGHQWALVESLPYDFTTSTARDAEAGRPSELDAITGSVVRAARRRGVAAPTLETLLEQAETAR
jgi:2-dehydropantoate 2-reductase